MWLRDLPAATIHIIEQSYTLAPTEQKRQIVRTSSGEYIATRPFLMKDDKKTTMGPSILFFLPESSIKALPDSTIRALPSPVPNTIYLSAPVPYIIHLPAPKLINPIILIMPEHDALDSKDYTPVVMLPSPDPIYPIIPVTPTYEALYSDEEYIPIVMLPCPNPIYPVVPIMPTMSEDKMEISLPPPSILMDHFNYIPSLSIPKGERTREKPVIEVEEKVESLRGPLREPLIGANQQILPFKSLVPFWEMVKTGWHSINKIRTIPHARPPSKKDKKITPTGENHTSCFYFTQLRKTGRLTLGSSLFISLNTIFYALTLHNTGLANTNPFLFLYRNNIVFDDLPNTVEGDILETEIEMEDLFDDQESYSEGQLIISSNQQLSHGDTSYFYN